MTITITDEDYQELMRVKCGVKDMLMKFRLAKYLEQHDYYWIDLIIDELEDLLK